MHTICTPSVQYMYTILFRFTIFWEIVIKIMAEEPIVSLQFLGF